MFLLRFSFCLLFFTSCFDVLFHLLNKPAIGAVSWAWLFAIAQFAMTWILSTVYSRKAAHFDRYVSALKADLKGEQT
ncbi:DUF485 domain-containing protein [Bacillus inaquosorum]|nr:DUF485 domain-containing protein [Bacillus inaquosorum]